MPRLVVNPSSPAGWEIQLKPGANFLGRGFANDFKFTDPSVSGSHCQIVVSDGVVVIKDLGSTNGTYVNRAKVQEAPLQSGQTVHLGGVEMLFQADEAPGAVGAAPVPGPVKVTIPTAAIPTAPTAGPIRIGPAATPTGPIPVATPIPAAGPIRVNAPPVTATSLLPAPPVRVVATSAGPAIKPMMLPPRIPTGPPLAATVAVEPPAAPGVAAPAGPHPCKHHPKTQGRFFCRQCNQFFCELCVTTRAAGAVQHKFCRHCGAECLQVQATVQPHVTTEKSFYARLPGAFMYPLRGAGVLMLIGGTIVFASLKMFGPGKFTVAAVATRGFGWGIIFQVFFLGYLFAYMQNIIHSTAAEESELPPLPGIADIWGDVVLPCLQLLGLVVFCFGPAIALEWFVIHSEESALGVAIIPAAILGGIYFPMAFLAVALLDSVAAANPLQVLPSIFKVPLEYFVTLVVLAAVWGIRALGDGIIPLAFPRGLTTHNMAKLFGYLGAEAFWALMCLYLLTVAMHILGLLYVSKQDKLGWLSH